MWSKIYDAVIKSLISVEKTIFNSDCVGGTGSVRSNFFELLGWNPQSIILTAKLWKQKSDLTLTDLYKFIAEEKPEFALDSIISLHMNEISRWHPREYSFMRILCLLPPSSINDLKCYWAQFKKVTD